MGSPITFSGFNNIDFGVVLNAIMLQERAPLAAVESQKTALQAQNSAFANFATKLGALESAVAALAGDESLAGIKATSSDEEAVGISTGSATISGRYEVVVSALARAQVTTSETTYTSLDAVVATSGVVSLARFGNPPIDIPVTGSMTIEELADVINQNPDSPVNASIVQVAPGQYRLVLTGRATGADNAFTVSLSSLSGGEGLTFVDTDGDGTSGDDAADNVQSAANASLTVNGVAVTSATNVLADVVPGVTLNLRRVDAANPVVVDVEKDHEATVAKVEAFATAYNNLIAFINEQTTTVESGKTGIGRDAMVRSLRDALRFTMMGAESGPLARLPEVGVSFDRTGKIIVEKDRLTEALNDAPADVQALFGGSGGTGGRFGALETLIADYTKAGGLVTNVRDRIDDQVARLTDRIAAMEAQLAIRRAALQREFIAADQAMSQLNSQANSLGQLGGQYRLF